MSDIIITDHAFTRAKQRCGWEGTRATLAALIGSYSATRLGISMGGEFRVNLRREGMTAIMDGSKVLTILGRRA